MTPELEKYYEERFAMFATQGWRDLVDDVENMLEATDTLSGVTPENVRFKQGEISIMKWVLTLKETTERTYEDLKNENPA